MQIGASKGLVNRKNERVPEKSGVLLLILGLARRTDCGRCLAFVCGKTEEKRICAKKKDRIYRKDERAAGCRICFVSGYGFCHAN